MRAMVLLFGFIFIFGDPPFYDLIAVIFKNIDKFETYANTIIGNDEVKNEFKVLANTVENIYEALKPEILNMEFKQKPYKEAIL